MVLVGSFDADNRVLFDETILDPWWEPRRASARYWERSSAEGEGYPTESVRPATEPAFTAFRLLRCRSTAT